LFTLISITLAQNLTFLPKSLAFSVLMSVSISVISVAILSTDSKREPCQIAYVIVMLVILLSTCAWVNIDCGSNNAYSSKRVA
jgi:hypothetical protein